MKTPQLAALLIFGVMTTVGAQDHHAGVMKRGAHVMGFDQTTTTHHFRLSKTGGVIEVTANDAKDTKAIAQIQSHLQHIAVMFSEGNFSAPMLIHAQEPPGVPDMKRAGADADSRSGAARRPRHEARRLGHHLHIRRPPPRRPRGPPH